MTNMEEQLQKLLSQTPEERLAELKNKVLEEKRQYAADFAKQLQEDLQAEAEDPFIPATKEYVEEACGMNKPEPAPTPRPPKQDLPSIRGFVYLGYSLGGDVAPWVMPLSEALNKNEYVSFSPRDNTYPHMLDLALQQKSCRLVSAVCRFLKLPENLTLAPTSNVVEASLRQALSDTATLDLFMFRDLYHLCRSDMIVADLIREPSPDLVQRLMYARFLDIPVVGIGPAGGSLSPFVQKLCKVVLTDEFNVANIMPLVRAYCAS